MYSAINVAFKPPCKVKTIIPSGMRKEARSMFIPVKAAMTAEPPNSNIEVTIIFVQKAKPRNT